MKKEELLKLEALDGPRLAEIAHEKVKGKPKRICRLFNNSEYVTPEENGMEFTMRLTAAPFEKLRDGSKKIELRLYDEKRQQIKIGDTILFISLKDPYDTVLTRVTDIYRFASFEDLYEVLPLEDLGYSAGEVATASSKDMDEFYSPEEQAQYGVVGFRLDLLPQR